LLDAAPERLGINTHFELAETYDTAPFRRISRLSVVVLCS